MLSLRMVTLIQTLPPLIRFPDDFAHRESDKQAHFRYTYRYDVADILLNAAEVISGATALEVLAHELQAVMPADFAAASEEQWHAVEAVLYAIRSIGRLVPSDESTVLPPVRLPIEYVGRSTPFCLPTAYGAFI